MAGDRQSVDVEARIGRRVRKVARVELNAVVEDRQDLIVGLRSLVETAAVNAGIGVGRRAVIPLARLHGGRGFFRHQEDREHFFDHVDRIDGRDRCELAAIEIHEDRVGVRPSDPRTHRRERGGHRLDVLAGEELHLQAVDAGHRLRGVEQRHAADRRGELERRLIRLQRDDRRGIIDRVVRARSHPDQEGRHRHFADDRATLCDDGALQLVERAVREGLRPDLHQEVLGGRLGELVRDAQLGREVGQSTSQIERSDRSVEQAGGTQACRIRRAVDRPRRKRPGVVRPGVQNGLGDCRLVIDLLVDLP